MLGSEDGKPKAVRQHELLAGLSEVLSEVPLIAIQNLPKDGLGIRRIHIAFLHGGARRKPSSLARRIALMRLKSAGKYSCMRR